MKICEHKEEPVTNYLKIYHRLRYKTQTSNGSRQTYRSQDVSGSGLFMAKQKGVPTQKDKKGCKVMHIGNIWYVSHIAPNKLNK